MGVLVVYSFGVLASAMAEDLALSRTQLPSVFMVFSLSVVLAGPVWGALTDRFGGRSITIISSILLAGLFCSLTILPGNIGFVYAAFAAIGLLASGTLPASYASIVVGWFDKRRGLALGITMMGVGAGAAAAPPLSAALLAEFGWRNTYLIFGLLIVLFSVPIMIAFLRPNPTAAAERQTSEKLPRLQLIRTAAKNSYTMDTCIFRLVDRRNFARGRYKLCPDAPSAGDVSGSSGGISIRSWRLVDCWAPRCRRID